jgi:Rrf2 family protein
MCHGYMRTSCRFAMAVHVLAVLAYKDGQCVTSGFLADSVNTNPVVIRRLLLALQRAKLVETRKGAGLGSRLARSPGKISLAEVYRAVEEDEPFALPPRQPNRKCPVGTCVQDTLEEVFVAAQKAMEREFANTSLGDVMQTIQAHCPDSDETVKPRAARI